MTELPTELPCPVADACESCGAPHGLAADEADTPAGVLCLTLCDPCAYAGRTPRLTPVQATYRVLEHGEHTGHPADADRPGQPGGGQ